MPYVPPPDNYDTQHEGTGHLAVNNTLTRRLLTRVALKITARIYGRRYGNCLPISKHLIVKTSSEAHLTEAATLQYIAANTSIPVPKVHCAFVHKNKAYIVMQRVKGITVAQAFCDYSSDQLSAIFKQLRTMLNELRALYPPPNVGVESCVGGSLCDSRIPHARPRFGPFKNTPAFHSWLREGLRPEDHPERDKAQDQDWQDIKALAAWHDEHLPTLVFTHGDLNPFNILVHEGQVVSIIDWEMSGWYPDYWEYTAAWYGNRIRLAWQRVLPQFLDTYPEELKMEITRQKWWGDL